MSTCSRREHVVTTVEYRVPANEPWGAAWNEVANAIDMAVREYQEMMQEKVQSGQKYIPSDDSIRFHAEDDTIVISFIKKEDGR